MTLDTKQDLAIASDKLILTGGPGTGKTYCMIKKLEILINEKKIAPEKILILYHGASALEQLKNKIHAKWGQEIADNIEVSTIIDFCISLCGENLFQIFKGHKSIWNAQKQEIVVDTILMDLFPDGFEPQQTKDLAQAINRIRQKDVVNLDLITQSYEIHKFNFFETIRTFYVGITRAKEQLYICSPFNNYTGLIDLISEDLEIISDDYAEELSLQKKDEDDLD